MSNARVLALIIAASRPFIHFGPDVDVGERV